MMSDMSRVNELLSCTRASKESPIYPLLRMITLQYNWGSRQTKEIVTVNFFNANELFYDFARKSSLTLTLHLGVFQQNHMSIVVPFEYGDFSACMSRGSITSIACFTHTHIARIPKPLKAITLCYHDKLSKRLERIVKDPFSYTLLYYPFYPHIQLHASMPSKFNFNNESKKKIASTQAIVYTWKI